MKTDDFPGCSKQQQQHLSAPFLFRLGWVRQSASFFCTDKKKSFFRPSLRENSHTSFLPWGANHWGEDAKGHTKNIGRNKRSRVGEE